MVVRLRHPIVPYPAARVASPADEAEVHEPIERPKNGGPRDLRPLRLQVRMDFVSGGVGFEVEDRVEHLPSLGGEGNASGLTGPGQRFLPLRPVDRGSRTQIPRGHD